MIDPSCCLADPSDGWKLGLCSYILLATKVSGHGTEESNKWLLRGLKMLPIHIGSGLEAFQLLPISEALTGQPVCAGTASFWGFSFTLADSGLVVHFQRNVRSDAEVGSEWLRRHLKTAEENLAQGLAHSNSPQS